MFKADGTRRDFPLKGQRVVLGRTNTCDLRIPLPSISRQHCEIEFDGDRALVRDLGSSNGTYHNGNRVQEATLSAGDEIVIGPVVFTVMIDGEPSEIEPVHSDVEAGGRQQEVTAAEPEASVAEAPEPESEPAEEAVEMADPGESAEAPQAIDIDDENVMPETIEEENNSPTVELDDPISALESLADSNVGDPDDEDDLPMIADDDDDRG